MPCHNMRCLLPVILLMITGLMACNNNNVQVKTTPTFKLIPTPEFSFNNFVDCNMASVWVGDSFRIFPGKYGEDPLWGAADDLKYRAATSVDSVFLAKPEQFVRPHLPPNAPVGQPGLHGAIWFETLYQDSTDTSGKTLYALYHNENYPETLPYDSASGIGYRDIDWPQGLKGAGTKTAVCRIGIMKSTDGGNSWADKGIVLEDLQPRLILLPHNNSINFAGGVGDPSAVAQGDYLYIFYGEYGYPGTYTRTSYDSLLEWSGQCVSVARIALKDLDQPVGKASRWDGKSFSAEGNGIGKPVAALQIPVAKGGGPTSSAAAKYYWGPSVSWNDYLQCWVMLMARAEGPSWKGSQVYISFNQQADLGSADHAQQWSEPQLLLEVPGHTVWYPSLQPLNTVEDRKAGYTSVRLGRKARLFYKHSDEGRYLSKYLLEFQSAQSR